MRSECFNDCPEGYVRIHDKTAMIGFFVRGYVLYEIDSDDDFWISHRDFYICSMFGRLSVRDNSFLFFLVNPGTSKWFIEAEDYLDSGLK